MRSHKFQQYFLVEQIECLGYKVESVSSVEEAMEFLEEKKVDIVLTDINMPNGLSGMMLCEWVAEKYNGLVKVLVMTGRIDSFDAKKAGEYGVVDFLPKPFSLGHLRTSLEEIILKDCLPVSA